MAFTVLFENEKKTYENPLSLLDIIGTDKKYLGGLVNNRIRELTYVIDKDCEVVPLTILDSLTKPMYESSLRFLVAMAMHNIHPDYRIRFSYNVSRSIFMQVLSPKNAVNGKMVKELEEEMERLVSLDLPLIRKIVSKEEAYDIWKKEGYLDKAEILKYRPEKTAHIYYCENYKNYMYNRMVPSTGYICKFSIKFFHPGVIIQYPRAELKGEIPPFEDAPTFGKVLREAREWAATTGADSIVGINKKIEQDGPVDFINLCEAKHNSQLAELGDILEKNKEYIRLICIAGPSSSGKTTFANRLRIELLSRGIRPIRISIDDYYKPKSEITVGPDGVQDLEAIDALDIELFAKDMNDLIEGNDVTLPKYNFHTGEREVGRTLRVGPEEPIIIEGIHALNELLTYSIPRHQKFKIFIAPQAQINIDDHNPLSLTELRLLRRIVRDNQFRNSSAEDTIAMWPSVRRGEFKWIYKTQEGADYVFNSLLPYELCCMKKHAMPLLEQIDTDSTLFPIAEKLIRMLKFFKDLPDEWIPCNSLMREFIGGSCYADV